MSEHGFRYYLRVRYGECDAQKVVFNARWGDYIDVAVAEFFRASGFEQELVSGALDYQLVKQTIEWRGPARYDDVLEARVVPRLVGNTSFTLATEFRRAGHAPLLVAAETVYVCVSADTLQKTPVPQDLRRVLAREPPDVQIDHAAYLRGSARS